MDSDLLFRIGNTAALVGWAALLASPWIPTVAERISGIVIPGLLAAAYAGLVMAFWAGAEGGFGSLDDVALLFRTREVLLAGWLHYLTFDLLIGAWEVRTARKAGIPFILIVPCLALTFLFGPAGFLVFLVVWGLRARAARTVGA